MAISLASTIFLFFSLLSIYLIPFPHRTADSGSLQVSYLLLLIIISYHFYVSYVSRLYTLGYIFNIVWLVSFWLALLTLAEVQYELTTPFIFFLAISIICFNMSYVAGNGLRIKPPASVVHTLSFLNDSKFLLYFFISALVCIFGYLYEIDEIGFVPILRASEEGFYGNDAPYLSVIHHLSTSLGAISGASLAFFLLSKRYRLAYAVLFFVSTAAAASMLAKNILLLSGAFALAILNFDRYLTVKRLLTIGFFFLLGIVFLMNIRLGDSDYISQYSAIDYDGLPQIFYWINTYLAINVTHLNTYFEFGYTPTYGLSTFQSFTSLLGIKDWAKDIIGLETIHYNGLGGNINVTPLHLTYLTDFGAFGVLAFIPLGFLAAIIDRVYRWRRSYFVCLLFAGLTYSFGLSVFGDFLHPLMVYVAIFFLYIPYIMYRRF